jgi:hypothetical protein
MAARSDRCTGAARSEQRRRTAGLAAREHRGAPADLPGPLYACRPSVAGRVIPAAAAPPLGQGLPGSSRHDHGLAPQVRLAAMGLLGTSWARASPDRSSDQKTDPVVLQNGVTGSDLASLGGQLALRYSLMRPVMAWWRLIRSGGRGMTVGSSLGASWWRPWWGRWLLKWWA